MFRPCQSPLGATTCPRLSHPSSGPVAGEPFRRFRRADAFIGWWAESRAVAFFLAESWTLMWAVLPCFRVAHVLTTGRQT